MTLLLRMLVSWFSRSLGVGLDGVGARLVEVLLEAALLGCVVVALLVPLRDGVLDSLLAALAVLPCGVSERGRDEGEERERPEDDV
ncbi:hypothetical protein G5V59_27045 [Nocardioides sp. W3-2-3]|uniref:hypothetical protein n=1 Tax=Nocardioides convexus TaxID=2712224 RepID=UPI002418AD8F|nr:hypothetical protein [Nocardioides convexus]NHA02050.1 hypothetical protein [Nocardioides convexus]